LKRFVDSTCNAFLRCPAVTLVLISSILLIFLLES
jgi:hypothetical protein